MLTGPILPFTAEAVAESLYQALDAAAVARGRATLAIPGGRSPGPVLSALAGMVDSNLRPKIHLCWLDERAVPREEPDRNDAPTIAAWEKGGSLPGGVYPMPAESPDLISGAGVYAALLSDLGADMGFDAALVGMGEDGHMASLFPDHPGLDELSPVFAITDSPKPPASRLSVSLPVILQTRHVALLVSGADKGKKVAEALKQESRSNPISLLPGDRTAIWADDAAMAAISA